MYLQVRDWVTFIRFGGLPSWTTRFLWVQIVHKMTRTCCRYNISFYLISLCSWRVYLTHCTIVMCLKSEVCIANWEPCQTTLEKVQCRNKWVDDSSSSLQRGHELWTLTPLSFKVRKVGRLSWRSLYIKLQILRGTLTFHIKCHKLDCSCVVHFESRL